LRGFLLTRSLVRGPVRFVLREPRLPVGLCAGLVVLRVVALLAVRLPSPFSGPLRNAALPRLRGGLSRGGL
jgi:hypothetical protein